MNPADFAKELNERQINILKALDEQVREVLVEPFTAAGFASASDVYAAGIILCRRERFPWSVLSYLYEMEMKCRTLEMYKTRPIKLNWQGTRGRGRGSSTK